MKRYWLMPAMMVLMAVMLPVSEIAAKEPDYEPAAEAFADIQVPGDGDTSAGDDLFMSDSAPDDTFTGDMADELTGDIADDASGKETASDGLIAEEEKEAPEADSSGFGYATPISVNANVIDSVPDNDEKYYKFSLSKPGYVGFRFSHNYVDTGSGAWRLYLYSSDDLRADQYLLKDEYVGNEMNEVVTYGTGLPAGTYYIEIDDLRSHGAQYQFTVTYKESNYYEKELNDKVSTANTISVNTFFHGNLMSIHDVDWYAFTLNTPGYVSFSFSHEFVDRGSEYWRLSLYSSADLNDELLQRGYIGNKMNEVTSYGTGLPAGKYFIKIENHMWEPVQYNFKVNFTKSSYYEKERNDGIASADPILLNTLYCGNIMDTYDEDVYKFVMEKTGNISITFSHDFVDSRTTYWKLYMYDMNDLNSNIIEYKYSGNTKDPVVSSQTYLKAGTYYIKITRDWESNVSYRFSVNTPMNKLTASNTSGGIRLSYSKVKNATKYLIYRNNSLIATVTGDSAATYTDKNKLKNGTKYTYKVVAVTNTSPRISKSVVIYRLSGGKITSAKNVKGRKMKVSWKKNSKASGYQIQYSTRSDFSSNKKTVNIKGKSTVSKKISKLTRGKKYYVRERAYKKSGGKKYYSAWSAVKKVKISK